MASTIHRPVRTGQHCLSCGNTHGVRAGAACGQMHPDRHVAATLDQLDRDEGDALVEAILEARLGLKRSGFDYLSPVLSGGAWLVEVWTDGSARIWRKPEQVARPRRRRRRAA